MTLSPNLTPEGCQAVANGLAVGWDLVHGQVAPSSPYGSLVAVAAVLGVLAAVEGCVLKWRKPRSARTRDDAPGAGEAPEPPEPSRQTPQPPQEPSEPPQDGPPSGALTDLRCEFKVGLESVRAAGKKAAARPWVLLIGDSGCGKTQAISSWGAGFSRKGGDSPPAGLGWWLSEEAVVLDTAGGLLAEDGRTGRAALWGELLGLLREARSGRPPHAIVLAVAADSLIEGAPEAVDRKAAVIARRLDEAREAFRGPLNVFAVVTRCDRLTGFGEFFAGLNEVRSRMSLGWAHPAPAGKEPFDGQTVEEHIGQLVARLRRRRLALVAGPGVCQDPSARRIDHVDALWGLPQSFAALAAPLRRFLTAALGAGWPSSKGPYLRGVYFTSAGQDAPGRRSYFLADLFAWELLRDKAPAPRPAPARKRRVRRPILLAAAAVGAIAVGLATWHGYGGLRRGLGAEARHWAAAGSSWQVHGCYWRPIVAPDPAAPGRYVYRAWYGRDGTARFHHETMALIRRPVQVPRGLDFAASLGEDFDTHRRQAHRVLFEAGVLRPILDAARSRLRDASAPWSPKATAALTELVRLAAAAARPPDRPTIDLPCLLDYVLDGAESRGGYGAQDLADLQAVFEWTYRPVSAGEAAWPPQSLGLADQSSLAAVDAGVERFVKYAGGDGIVLGTDLPAIQAVLAALGPYEKAEASVLAAGAGPADALPDVAKAADLWNARLRALDEAAREVDRAIAAANLAGKSVVDVYDAMAASRLSHAEAPRRDLLAAAETLGEAGGDEQARTIAAHLQAVAARVRRCQSDLQGRLADNPARRELAEMNARHLEPLAIADAEVRRRLGRDAASPLALRRAIYDAAAAALAVSDPAPAMDGLAPALAAVGEDTRRAAADIDALAAVQPTAFHLSEAAAAAKSVVDRLARRRRVHALLTGGLQSAPGSAGEIAASVAAAAAKLPPVARPHLPGSPLKKGEPFDARYHPQAAAAVLRNWQAAAQFIEAGPGADLPADTIDRDGLRKLYVARRDAGGAYLAEYRSYWTAAVPADLTYAAEDWQTFQADLVAMQAARTAETRADLCRTIEKALGEVRQALPPDARASWAASAEHFAESARRLASPIYLASWQAWLGRWKDLAADPRQARKTLLATTPGRFVSDYMPFTADSDSDVSERYWAAFGRCGLRLLAGRIDADVQAACGRLRGLARFPLAAPRAADAELAPADLAEARAALAEVLASSEPWPAGSIGAGRRTGLDRLDSLLDLAGGQGMGKEGLALCRQVEGFLAGLPEAGAALDCQLRILPEARQRVLLAGAPPALGMWAVLQVDQARARKGIANLTQSETKDLAAVAFPGEDIELKFYRFPSDVKDGKVDRTVTIRGPWGPLRLLHALGAKRTSADGRRWHVEIAIDDSQAKPRSFWLELDFPHGLPPLEQWTKAAGNRE